MNHDKCTHSPDFRVCDECEDKNTTKVVQAILDDWIDKNPGLKEDLAKLVAEVMAFNIKWGTDLKSEKLITLRN